MRKFYKRVNLCQLLLSAVSLLFLNEGVYALQQPSEKLAEPLVPDIRKDTLNVLYGSKPAAGNLQSVSAIYTGQLTTTPAPLYTYALTGRMPGLQTQQISGWPLKDGLFPEDVNPHLLPVDQRYEMLVGRPGEPTDNAEIMLSLRGQRPVTIIDGVQRDISSIPPENIESITLLKDALSTILLGQRSSRGVLLVTTKRAEPGGPYISFTGQAGLQTPVDLPQPLPAHELAWLYNEALLNDGLDAAYTAADFNAYRNGSSPYTHPDVDWYETLLKENAPISRFNLGISGGGETARYVVSLDYMNRQGLLRETDFDNNYNTNAYIDRYVINTNIDVDLNENFTVALGLFGRIQNGNQPGASTGAVFAGMFNTPRNAHPVLNPNGSLAGTNLMRNNPYGLAGNSGYQLDYSRDLVANIELKYELDDWTDGLWAKMQANTAVMAASATNRSKGFPVFEMTATASDTTYNRFNDFTDQLNDFRLLSNAQYWYAQLQTGLDKQIGDHGLSTLLHADLRQVTLTNGDVTLLPEKYTNIAARVSYNFAQKYFAEAAVNYSGYDQFLPGKRFGFFYAGGLGWNMAEEPFIKDNASWINMLKWRATWGKTGNANVAYFVGKQYYQANFFRAYPSNRGFSNGIQELPVANPDATWEKADKLTVGLDVSLFRDRLQLTAEYYHDKYYDLMQQRGRNSSLLGNLWPEENIGIHRYTGQELSLTWQDRTGGFNWFVTANASTMQSKVLYQDEIRRMHDWNRRTGQPVGQTFGYIAEGFFQSQQEIENSAAPLQFQPRPGDIKYRDLNGDGIIDQFDEAPIGNTGPLIFYGATLGFRFKGFDCRVLFQGVKNRDILLTGPAEWEFYTTAGTGQAFEHHLNRWTPETAETATYPRLSTQVNNNNRLISSFWVRSGDFFRIKNIDIGYTLPGKWTESMKLRGIRIFANGLNLFTWAGYDRMDPEVNGSTYPLQRVINAGVNVEL